MRAERVAWSDDAQTGLSETFNGERDLIKADIDEGRAHLWKLDNGKAWLVFRIEGAEFVIMCFQGRNFRTWMHTLYRYARSHGCTTARFHTSRPGLARLSPYPVTEIERVYRIRLR